MSNLLLGVAIRIVFVEVRLVAVWAFMIVELLVCLLTHAVCLRFLRGNQKFIHWSVYHFSVMKTDKFIARLFDIYQESYRQGNVQVRCRVIFVCVVFRRHSELCEVVHGM